MLRHIRPVPVQHLPAVLVDLHLGYALMACQLEPETLEKGTVISLEKPVEATDNSPVQPQ